MDRVPHAGLQKLISIVDTMHENSLRIYREKKAAVERGDAGVKEQLNEGKDLMSILRMVSVPLFGCYSCLTTSDFFVQSVRTWRQI